MKTLNTEKRSIFYYFLIISSFFTYVALTTSKSIYTANKTTLYSLGIFGNLTDLATTFEYYFYTYAIMQLFLAFFMKKINVKWFLCITVGISAILTSLMAFTNTITQHYLIYTVNGILQAGVWGCLFKNLSKYLPQKFLGIGNGVMSAGPTTSYALSYVITALFDENWRTPFMLMGIVLFVAVVVYFISVTIISKLDRSWVTKQNYNTQSLKTEENPLIKFSSKKGVITFYVLTPIIGFIITSVYFMLSTNVDFFLKEVGGFTNSQSKSLTIIATIVTVVGPLITVSLCEKYRNYIIVGGVLCSIALVFMLMLVFAFEYSAIFSLIIFIIFLIIINGARTITLSIVGVKQRSNIDSGTFITAVNVFSSLSSGVAPKLISMIIDNENLSTILSWRISFIIIAVAVFTLSVFCLLSGLIVNKKNRKLQNN
ncbi:MAG: MFS transporter [Clostridia bacterium]|nr:MFS transporter [Clostridia bacterium]